MVKAKTNYMYMYEQENNDYFEVTHMFLELYADHLYYTFLCYLILIFVERCLTYLKQIEINIEHSLTSFYFWVLADYDLIYDPSLISH